MEHERHLVFVYGSLLSGSDELFHNHQSYLGPSSVGDGEPEATLLGNAVTETSDFVMVFRDGNTYPFCIDERDLVEAQVELEQSEQQGFPTTKCKRVALQGAQPTQIKGEVWRVPASTIDRLDSLEGHPTFYRRRMVPVVLTNEDDEFHACSTPLATSSFDGTEWQPTIALPQLVPPAALPSQTLLHQDPPQRPPTSLPSVSTKAQPPTPTSSTSPRKPRNPRPPPMMGSPQPHKRTFRSRPERAFRSPQAHTSPSHAHAAAADAEHDVHTHDAAPSLQAGTATEHCHRKGAHQYRPRTQERLDVHMYLLHSPRELSLIALALANNASEDAAAAAAADSGGRRGGEHAAEASIPKAREWTPAYTEVRPLGDWRLQRERSWAEAEGES